MMQLLLLFLYITVRAILIVSNVTFNNISVCIFIILYFRWFLD